MCIIEIINCVLKKKHLKTCGPQFEHNKTGAAVVDVVVDPYISQHLRPHQRAGVSFLYQCILGMKSFPGRGAILA